MSEHGLAFGAPVIDVNALRSWKDGVVSRLTGGLAGWPPGGRSALSAAGARSGQ